MGALKTVSSFFDVKKDKIRGTVIEVVKDSRRVDTSNEERCNIYTIQLDNGNKITISDECCSDFSPAKQLCYGAKVITNSEGELLSVEL